MADSRRTGDDLWEPIVLEKWRETPCLRGLAAVEDDVKAGRAVFYLETTDGRESYAVAMSLPRCALLCSEGDAATPVILIQAEVANNGAGSVKVLAGYRPLAGGNGVCLLSELEFVEETDDRFAPH